MNGRNNRVLPRIYLDAVRIGFLGVLIFLLLNTLELFCQVAFPVTMKHRFTFILTLFLGNLFLFHLEIDFPPEKEKTFREHGNRKQAAQKYSHHQYMEGYFFGSASFIIP